MHVFILSIKIIINKLKIRDHIKTAQYKRRPTKDATKTVTTSF